ncbi:MAG: mercury methylation ferredoxin HgcB [Nitrospirota bacterium]|nr:mercury methylation ferredoxin HgcB [Nitrospirota bacterium]
MKYLANTVSLAYDENRCEGCGRCVEVCPHGVFEMEARRAKVTDRDKCMECGACALNCEFKAITVNAGVGCAAALINSMIIGGEPTCGCGDSGPACC